MKLIQSLFGKKQKDQSCCSIKFEEVKEENANDCCNIVIEEVKEKQNDCCSQNENI